MLLEKRYQFLFKCVAAVMLLLRLDAGNSLVNLRYPDAESSVTLLPGEPGKVEKGLVNPF
jgi:hypothetical protein